MVAILKGEIMHSTEILSLPKYNFAHIHQAEQYHHKMEVNNHRMEISYISEGNLIAMIENESIVIEKGDICCFYSVPVTIDTDSYHCHHTFCVYVDWQTVPNPNHLLLPPVTKCNHMTTEIEGLIDDFIYNTHLYDSHPERVAWNFFQILNKIDICNRTSDALDYPRGYILAQRAKKYVHQNIHSTLTQAEIAMHLGITPSYLCNIFKTTEGIPLMKYINQIKLKNIQSLMENRDMKLYDAALMFGYTDPNYVSSLYSKMFGHPITSKPNLSNELVQKKTTNIE